MTVQSDKIVNGQSDKIVNGQSHNKKYENDKGKSWPQILAVLAVTLGPWTNGIMFSWPSPFALVISNDKENYDITEDEAAYFLVFQPVGMIFTSLFFFKVSELLGRKKSLLSLAVPQLISWIIIIYARTKWEFYAARFFAGMGNGIIFCTVPPYVGEITTPTIRGYFGNMPSIVHFGGSVFITVLGSYTDVRTATYICIGFPVLYAILVSLLPESPYQLFKDGEFDEARKSLKWLLRKVDVEEDFLIMKADVERQLSESGKWVDLIKIDSNRRAMRAGVFLRFSQQFCGIGVFATYTQVIFEKAGTNIGPQYASMIFVLVIWVLIVLCSASVEKFGRKICYFYSLLGCGIVLVGLSVYFLLEEYKFANLDSVNWFPLAGMLAWVLTFSFGLGIIPTLMLGELFSASIKPKALSFLILTFGVAEFLTTFLFNVLSTNVGLYSPFLLYGITCLISSVLTLRWVPETKGKSLEEIQQAFKK